MSDKSRKEEKAELSITPEEEAAVQKAEARQKEHNSDPNTESIDIDEITSIADEIEEEETVKPHHFGHKRKDVSVPVRRPSRRRRWAILIGSILAAAVLGGAFGASTNHTNHTTPTPAKTSASATLSPYEDLAYSLAAQTNLVIGQQLHTQFGKDTTAYGKITLGTSTDHEVVDSQHAYVARATYANVPKTFDYKSSAKFFIDKLSGIAGNWKAITTTTPASGTSQLYSVKLYDASKNPANPAILQIDYFTQTAKNADKNLIITISSTLYEK